MIHVMIIIIIIIILIIMIRSIHPILHFSRIKSIRTAVTNKCREHGPYCTVEYPYH